MLFNLSIKNLKKSIRDYSIYFFTLILGVCIFYVFNAIGDQSAMMEVSRTKSDVIDTMVTALSVMSVVVSIILGFLIVYASRFLIRKRKKEFGIYLTLGMHRLDIARILLTETVIIGLISLGIGLAAGIGLSQFMSLLVANMFQADMSRFVFVVSKGAVGKTVCFYGIIYCVVMVMNTIVIVRSKVIDLFTAGKKKEKSRLKKPALCVVVFLAASVLLGSAYYNVTANVQSLETQMDVAVQIIFGIVGTFLVFWSVSGFAHLIVKKLPGLYHRRLDSFVLSEAGAQINTSVTAGSIICLLLFATICILSSAFTLKEYKEKNVAYVAPASVSMSREMADGRSVGDVLEEKGFSADAFERQETFFTYRTDNVTEGSVMGSHMDELIAYAPDFEALAREPMEIIKESDYNRAARIYGFEEVSLDSSGYAVSADYEGMVEEYNEGLKANDTIEVCGQTLKSAYEECVTGYLMMSYDRNNMGILIVPDVVDLPEEAAYKSYLIADYKEAYNNREFQSFMDDGGFNEMVNASEDERGQIICGTQSNIYDDNIGSSGMVVFIALYLGFVFVISGAAILALKEMSDAIESRGKYETLRQLGAGERECDRALFAQMSIFFGAPLLLAVIHSVFGIQVCCQMLDIYNSESILPSIVITAGVIVVIYGAYFFVSYLCCRKMIREK